MPSLDWSRIGDNETVAKVLTTVSLVFAVLMIASWALGSNGWILAGGLLWGAAGLAYLGTAAGWLPESKRRRR
jgi:predicted cobalt transporter CbtA